MAIKIVDSFDKDDVNYELVEKLQDFLFDGEKVRDCTFSTADRIDAMLADYYRKRGFQTLLNEDEEPSEDSPGERCYYIGKSIEWLESRVANLEDNMKKILSDNNEFKKLRMAEALVMHKIGDNE